MDHSLRHTLSSEQLCELMERCGIVRLSELTGESIGTLIDCYRKERGLKTLWRERAWGEPDERAAHAIEHGDSTVLQMLIVRQDVTDVFLGSVARPTTAWQLYYLLDGADPQRFALKGFRQPDYMPYSGKYWVSIWGGMYRADPYDDAVSEVRTVISESSSEVFAFQDWLAATIRTTASQGTGDMQSREFDRGMIHGLTLALNRLTETVESNEAVDG